MEGGPSTSAEIYHVFETPRGAELFQKAFNVPADKILHDHIGGRLGLTLPSNAEVYLWPFLDESGGEWVDNIAASSKATLKLTWLEDDLYRWLRSRPTSADLAEVMADSESVKNIEDKTDYDCLLEVKRKANAMTQDEFRREMVEVDKRVWLSHHKYSEDDEITEDLVGKSPLEYDKLRETAAQRLNCRASVLDKVIEEHREPKQFNKTATAKPVVEGNSKLQGSAVLCPDVEPWPEAVDGGAVLNEIAETLERYVALPQGAPDALALYCAHTHCFEVFTCSPRLNITSPEHGCGKSTLKGIVALFVNRPLCLDSLTTAVTFRLLDKHAPTLLADESDAWLRDNEELRGALNAGHERGGLFARCEGDGNEVRAFRVFAPAALCGIGALPGTLHDRSIVIPMKRAKPGELRARFDSRYTAPQRELCWKLARWIDDNREQIAGCDPTLPNGCFNRFADNWRPLFAIAEVLGGNWPQRCAEAYAKLTSRDMETESYRVMALADIRELLNEKPELVFNGWLASGDIIEYLTGLPERPWGEANRGKPITLRWLAVKLHGFGIEPGRFRDDDGKQVRGYKVGDFQDAIERFLSSPVTSGQASHTMENGDSQASQQVSQETPVQVSQSL